MADRRPEPPALWRTQFSRKIDSTEVASVRHALFQQSPTSSRTGPPPLVYPIVWLGPSGVGDALAGLVNYDKEILFHELQELSYERQLLLGAAYDIEIALGEAAGTGRRIEIVLSAVDRSGLQVLRMRTLLRVLELETLRGSMGEAAKPKGGSRVAENFVLEGVHRIDQAGVSRYLAMAGDDNPIHREGPGIRRFGLSAPIMPGMLVFSLIGESMEKSVTNGEIRTLSCRFLWPLTVPADVAIRRRVVRSKPMADGVETIARIYAGTEACPTACMAETGVFERNRGPGARIPAMNGWTEGFDAAK